MIYKAVIIKLWLPRYLIALPCFDLTFRKAHRRSGSCAYWPCQFERSFNKTFSLQVAVQRRTTSCCTKQCFSEREEIIGIFNRLNSSSWVHIARRKFDGKLPTFLHFHCLLPWCFNKALQILCLPPRKKKANWFCKFLTYFPVFSWCTCNTFLTRHSKCRLKLILSAILYSMDLKVWSRQSTE